MALTFGGRRRPGGRGPRTPLNPLEKRLADRIAEMMRSLARLVDVDAYANAIRDLDPDTLEQLLHQSALRGLDERIADTMRSVILDGGTAEARRIIAATPIPTRTPVAALEYPGVRLPSGIIVPEGLGPAPDVEFRVASPRDDMLTHVDRRATQYAQTRAAELVTSVDQSNRLAIRQIIADAFTGPVTVDDTARRLRQVVGLHPRWARAVVNFEDANYRRLLAEGVAQDVARERVDGLTKRYRDRLIRRRAEMIARTEIMRASNYGRTAAWEAGVRTGYVDPRSMKEWSTAPFGSRYGEPCDVCAPMKGKRVPWNGTFPNGYQHPPAHPHCRCVVVLIPPDRGVERPMSEWLDELDADERASEAEDLAEYDRRREAFYAKQARPGVSLTRPVLKHGDPSRPDYAQLHPNSKAGKGIRSVGHEGKPLPAGWSMVAAETRVSEALAIYDARYPPGTHGGTRDRRDNAMWEARRTAREETVYEGPGGARVYIDRIQLAEGDHHLVTQAQLAPILTRVTKLQGIAPIGEVDITIRAKDFATRDPAVMGWALLGSDRVLFADTASPTIIRQGAQRIALNPKGVTAGGPVQQGFHRDLMPSAITHSDYYYLAHEWGHAVDRRSDRWARDDRALTSFADGLSEYGRSSEREAYAESFAEWSNTGGESTIPVVQFYAERYGWADGGQVAKAADGPQPRICLDTFVPGGGTMEGDEPVAKHGDHDQSTHGRRGRRPSTPSPEPSGRTVLRDDGSFRYGEIDFGSATLPSVEQASQRFAYWGDNWATRVASANMMGLRPPRARNGHDDDSALSDDEEMIFTAKYGEIGTYAEQQARPKIRAAIVLLDASARTVQTETLWRGLEIEETDPRFSMTRGDYLTLPISAFSTDRRVADTYASGATRMRPTEPHETPRRSLILRVQPGARGHATDNETEVVSQGYFRIVDVADETLVGWSRFGDPLPVRIITLRQDAHFDVRTGDWETTDYV